MTPSQSLLELAHQGSAMPLDSFTVLAERRAAYIASVADKMALRMGGRFMVDPKRWEQFVVSTSAALRAFSNSPESGLERDD